MSTWEGIRLLQFLTWRVLGKLKTNLGRLVCPETVSTRKSLRHVWGRGREESRREERDVGKSIKPEHVNRKGFLFRIHLLQMSFLFGC